MCRLKKLLRPDEALFHCFFVHSAGGGTEIFHIYLIPVEAVDLVDLTGCDASFGALGQRIADYEYITLGGHSVYTVAEGQDPFFTVERINKIVVSGSRKISYLFPFDIFSACVGQLCHYLKFIIFKLCGLEIVALVRQPCADADHRLTHKIIHTMHRAYPFGLCAAGYRTYSFAGFGVDLLFKIPDERIHTVFILKQYSRRSRYGELGEKPYFIARRQIRVFCLGLSLRHRQEVEKNIFQNRQSVIFPVLYRKSDIISLMLGYPAFPMRCAEAETQSA